MRWSLLGTVVFKVKPRGGQSMGSWKRQRGGQVPRRRERKTVWGNRVWHGIQVQASPPANSVILGEGVTLLSLSFHICKMGIVSIITKLCVGGWVVLLRLNTRTGPSSSLPQLQSYPPSMNWVYPSARHCPTPTGTQAWGPTVYPTRCVTPDFSPQDRGPGGRGLGLALLCRGPKSHAQPAAGPFWEPQLSEDKHL